MRDKFTIPDSGDIHWKEGSETFTRQEVFSLLFTQRSMIYNDIKRCVSKDRKVDVDDLFHVVTNPRLPKF